jgi:predicted nucleic acid-binding protein
VIYLDSSCFLKLLIDEPDSEAVDRAVAREPVVVVSVLVQLEASVQLRARRLGGLLGERRYRSYLDRIESLREVDPFRFVTLPGTVFDVALRQQTSSPRVHVRSLDRLHVAAMEELGLRRLMTSDVAQARAAEALGFDVVTPDHP